jgi:multiple sugar transport system substrate-binding protein
MTRKKSVYRLLIFLLVAALIAGCSGGTTQAPAPPDTGGEESTGQEQTGSEGTGERLEITAWTFTYQPFVDGLNALAEEFNQSQSDYTVNVEVFEFSAYWDKIAAAVATGTGPDVFHGYTGFLGRYIAEGVIQPIPEDQFPFDDMAPMVKQFRVADQLWAVPMGVRTFAYVYNPELYAEAGVEPPTTWEEEITVAEQLTKFDDQGKMTIAGEGVYPKWEGFTLWQLKCVQAGGSYISEDLRTMTWDDPACIEAFKFMTSKMTDHQIFVDGFYDDWPIAWAEGALGGIFGPSGMLGALDETDTEYAVAPMTAGPASDATLGNFWPLVVTQQAKDAKWDAAMAFMKFAASPDGNRTWCRLTKDVPALLEVAAEDEFANSTWGGFVQAMPNSVFVFDPDSINTRVGWEQAWDKVTLQGADPEQALLEGMPEAQAVLDEFWAKMDATYGTQ